MKASPLLVCVALCFSWGLRAASASASDRAEAAQDQAEPGAPGGALFPGARRFSVSMSTGVPFWVMGELGYGLTRDLAVGLLAGATPLVGGFGIRPRVALPLSRDWRVLAMASGLYYPPNAGSREWWLVRPSALIERRAGRVSLALGGGMVAAATSDELFGEGGAPDAPSPYPTRAKKSFDEGAWLTANAIGTVALSPATHLFADAAVVFDRQLRLATNDWIGGPPAIVFLGVETRL